MTPWPIPTDPRGAFDRLQWRIASWCLRAAVVFFVAAAAHWSLLA